MDRDSYTVGAVYQKTISDPKEVVNRCPYPGCHGILFKGVLGKGTNAEFLCTRCNRLYRIVVTNQY